MSTQPWSAAQRATFATTALAVLVFVPYLGATGLWDPWETHYCEVAREMIDRGDFVHPHWEKSYFFSKPALTMWLQAFGMLVATRYAGLALLAALGVTALGARRWRTFGGAMLTLGGGVGASLLLTARTAAVPWKLGGLTSGDGALPLMTEWGVRLPFAVGCIAAVAVLTWALSRTVSARVGFLSGLVLMTMPLYFLLARQAVTDPVLVSATVIGVSCALVARFDAQTQHRARWWYGAWASFAAATLAKGWLGFLVPGAVLVGYLGLFVVRRGSLRAESSWLRQRLATPLSWAMPAGLFSGLIAFELGRAHGTTFVSGPALDGGLPGSGHDLFGPPHWLGLTWGLLTTWAVATFVKPGDVPPAPPVCAALDDMRLGRGVTLFLCLSMPWYYAMFTFAELDDEGKLFWVRFIVHDHLSRFFAGVFTTTPGGSFTYFLEQGGYAVFPWVLLVPGALAVAARVRVRECTPRDFVAGIAALWLGVSWLLVGDSATKFHHYVFPLLPPLAVLIALFIDEVLTDGLDRHVVALALGVPLFLLVGKDVWTSPKVFTDLFVFNYDRPWPEFLVTRPVVGAATVKDLFKLGALSALGVMGLLVALDRRRAVFATLAVSALSFSLWFSWSYWVDLSHHWTQRELFWRYETLRAPGEPIAAFLMNWRGETFYSRNEVVQIPLQDTARALASFVGRSKRVWVLVEHARLPVLRSALGARHVETIEPGLNNKFVLVSVESG